MAAPYHTFEDTEKEVLAAYGKRIDEIFVSFDRNPIASGAIAQVHIASILVQRTDLDDSSGKEILSDEKGSVGVLTKFGRKSRKKSDEEKENLELFEEDDVASRGEKGVREMRVAVKVRHPKVAERAFLDLRLLIIGSKIIDMTGGISSFSLFLPFFLILFPFPLVFFYLLFSNQVSCRACRCISRCRHFVREC
jgi:predicted unusual protein kinase regulating ubiquinone biosynthesis (AarF/ABC1/UbiB family)